MKQYFYILTIQWTEAAAVQVYTHTGVANVYDGEDQQSVFKALHTETCKAAAAPFARAGVSYYYLAEQQL